MLNNQRESRIISTFKNKLKNKYPNIYLTHLSKKG